MRCLLKSVSKGLGTYGLPALMVTSDDTAVDGIITTPRREPWLLHLTLSKATARPEQWKGWVKGRQARLCIRCPAPDSLVFASLQFSEQRLHEIGEGAVLG